MVTAGWDVFPEAPRASGGHLWPTCLRKHSDVMIVHHADGLRGPQRATDNEDAPDTRKDGHLQIIAWDVIHSCPWWLKLLLKVFPRLS